MPLTVQRALKAWGTALLLTILLASPVFADGPIPPKPKDKCPVCGMFVSLYPKWVAEITFVDGTSVVFDGPKDMFRYYFNISKYNHDKSRSDISGIYVSEYYSARMMSARHLYFVKGSNIMGPMGNEFVPIRGKREAETFMRDHWGKKIFTFQEIRPSDIPR